MKTRQSTMSNHKLRDLTTSSFPSPIKRVRAKRALAMSESDNNSSMDEEMLEDHHTHEHSSLIKPHKLVFDSPEKQDGDHWASNNNKPSINVQCCDDEHNRTDRMTPPPPQSNSTPIHPRSHSQLYRVKNPFGDHPSTPKCFRNSFPTNTSHLHVSRDSSKVLVANIFSPEGMCLESAKKQYHIKRQRQMLKSFDNVDTKSPSSTSRVCDDDSTEDYHPVFDLKSISTSSIDHNRYALEFLEQDLLGSGEFGEVYKCLKYMDGMTYAVKRTKRAVISTVYEKEFRKEIHAHAILSRMPHIVNYFSSWADQGVLYLQLEYCNGGTLEQVILDKCAFSEESLRQLLFQVCEGLRCMHNMRMVHMDIKPANLMIVKPADMGEVLDTERIHYKIGDFGHVVADDDCEVEEGDCRYLPKELLSNSFDNLSKVDIFSLGLTLYEASGVTPLPKNGALWHHIREGNLEQMPNVSNDLHHLMKIMIHKDPTQRPTALDIIKMRASPYCNCICCTHAMDSQCTRNFDFKSNHIQQFIESRTVPPPGFFPT